MSQKHQAPGTALLRCKDHHCQVMGTLCCLNCKQTNNCPIKCPTVQQFQNPEYEGCPHLITEANSQ